MFLGNGCQFVSTYLGEGYGVKLGFGATILEVTQWLLLLGTTLGCVGILLSLRWGFLMGVLMPLLWVFATLVYVLLFWEDLRAVISSQLVEEAARGEPIPSQTEVEQFVEWAMRRWSL